MANWSDNEQDDDWAWLLFFVVLILIIVATKVFQPQLIQLIPGW